MAKQYNVGFMLAALILVFTLPLAAHAESLSSLKSSYSHHSSKGNSYMRQKQFALAEREYDRAISYQHKLKRKCRGLFKRCRITDKRVSIEASQHPIQNVVFVALRKATSAAPEVMAIRP